MRLSLPSCGGVSGLVALVACLLCLGSGASAAAAEASVTSPWWDVTSGAQPTDLPPGGEGTLLVGVSDIGDASAEGAVSPIRIADSLPSDLTATGSISASIALGNHRTPLACSAATLTCETGATLALGELIEISIKVRVSEGAVSGELNRVNVSGGGAPLRSIARPVSIGESTAFGVEENELSLEEGDGQPPTQAGSHPFQVTSTIILNHQANGEPAALAKDVGVELPAGLVGYPAAVPKCTLGQFLDKSSVSNTNECPPQTALGVATIHAYSNTVGNVVFTVPVFNLEPAYGEPARFGFYVTQSDSPVLLDTSLRSGPGEDYGITVTAHNITQVASFISSQLTFWGTPGDPRHNPLRGWGCLNKLYHTEEDEECATVDESTPEAFQILPASCSGHALEAFVQADSWKEPGNVQTLPTTEPLPTLDGCNRLPFAPSMDASPTTTNASSASGLDFNLNFHDEGLTAPEGLAQSQLNRTEVVLPAGFTIDPSAGVGLAGCTPEDYARETIESAPGAGCPNESKLGTVEIETPLLTQKIDGNIFIAQPYDNPFPEPGHPGGTLVALYIVAKNPETGVLIKLAGKVTPNPVTGQLTTTFENNPQLPFDHFNFHFREGVQAPLITPATCGTYTTRALLAPWSEPLEALTDTSSFEITSGSGGGACPSGGMPPFNPRIVAGMLNDNAGSFSELYVDLSRTDAEQEISEFSTVLPPGMSGILTGIPYCSEAQIEAARHKTGAEEEANPSCPAASQIGHTEVGTGVGQVLAYVPGKIYLAGPFKGAPFSIVSITSAKVGPFDLGTVVLRFGLNIDQSTAQVSVNPSSSEPIPTIIDGIVTHVRDIKVYIDRPNFTINPTSCEKMNISSTLHAHEGANATVSSPFQDTNCAALKFEPKVTASVSGKVTKANGTSFHLQITKPDVQGEQADLKKFKIELPVQLPSRLTTLQKACTSAQFEANPAGCPSASAIGFMKANTPLLPVPVEGPMYFVSHGGEAFPSLEIVLQGDGVKVILIGQTYISKSGITSSTFSTIPDVPFSTAEVELHNGPYSALTGNGNLCAPTITTTVKKKVTVKTKIHGRVHKQTVTRKVKETKPTTLSMPTEMIGQNGAAIYTTTHVTVNECPKAKTTIKKTKAKHKKRHKGKKSGKK